MIWPSNMSHVHDFFSAARALVLPRRSLDLSARQTRKRSEQQAAETRKNIFRRRSMMNAARKAMAKIRASTRTGAYRHRRDQRANTFVQTLCLQPYGFRAPANLKSCALLFSVSNRIGTESESHVSFAFGGIINQWKYLDFSGCALNACARGRRTRVIHTLLAFIQSKIFTLDRVLKYRNQTSIDRIDIGGIRISQTERIGYSLVIKLFLRIVFDFNLAESGALAIDRRRRRHMKYDAPVKF